MSASSSANLIVANPAEVALRMATFVLVALASLAAGWARQGADLSPVLSALPSLAWTLAAVTAAIALDRLHVRVRYRWCLILLAAALVSLPIVMWIAAKERPPLELVLLAVCRNGLLTLTGLAVSTRQMRWVAGASLFVVMFALMRIEHRLAAPLLSIYAAAGCGWLCLHPYRSASTLRPASLASVLVIGALLSGVGMWVTRVGEGDVAGATHGWLPSSGGIESGNESATAGVGDGPDEVSGSSNAKSIGFDQSNSFMQSERSGLYDAFLETYGLPTKSHDFVKMQMLHIRDITAVETTNVDDYRQGKQFTLNRTPPITAKSAAPHAAKAMLYVRGKLPLHLRTGAFDAFDGQTWRQAARPGSGWSLYMSADDPTWFGPTEQTVYSSGPGLDSRSPWVGSRAVRVRIGTLESDSIPLPPDVERLHVGRITRLSLFDWKAADVLRMTRRSVPIGTVVDAECGVLDPSRLMPWSWGAPASRAALTVSPAISVLARQWVHGIDCGWPQVAAITDRLRSTFTLDQNFRPATPSQTPVEDFLTRDRRGPDYQFASAAVLMLRSLGFPARLASGFYAGSTRYDAATDEAALTAADVHTWAEVLVAGRWAVVDATPGYAVAEPDAGWFRTCIKSVRDAFRGHSEALVAISAITLLTIIFRTWWIDKILTLRANLHRGSALEEVAATTKLLEARARLSGVARPREQTFARWMGTLDFDASDDVQRSAQCLGRYTTWAAYAPSKRSPWPEPEVRAVCSNVRRQLTARRLHRVARGPQTTEKSKR